MYLGKKIPLRISFTRFRVSIHPQVKAIESQRQQKWINLFHAWNRDESTLVGAFRGRGRHVGLLLSMAHSIHSHAGRSIHTGPIRPEAIAPSPGIVRRIVSIKALALIIIHSARIGVQVIVGSRLVGGYYQDT
jgi:hypothetical protein